ncbi:putative PMR5 domain, PC-Esterase [Dioscorea sansibarensis]
MILRVVFQMARKPVSKPSHSLLLLFFITIFPVLLASLDMGGLDQQWLEEKEDEVDEVQSHQPSPKDCDFSIGEWVYDKSYPLYDATCPYLSTQVSCRRNGRPDLDYEKWRWRPQHCWIPRFNALDFLEKIRKKRVMLVGDSIMRNQWESLVCLVESVIPAESKMVSSHGPTMAFHAMDYQASIEFSWAPLLVELKEEGNKRVVHLDAIEENAKYWRGVDVLVFDSAHWWTHTGKWRTWDFYMEGERIFKDLNPMVAYEKGLTTWAKWVDLNLDPRTTRVIFRSVSPRHNRENGWQCYKQREPSVYSGYTPHVPGQLVVLREVVKKMKFPCHLQDITSMSALRRDGHPSVYTGAVPGLKAHQSSDCSHWCLPGVPDTWNELLYALLF